ncbi:MAG TPA: AAA family ATPase [Pirellulales bacterium]|nr:AAA family ATPase [Pirellulales bacterium]
MKVREIKIDGFGVWTGLDLADLDDHLNVFYGPNEAGKTTLMQFVRAMLYGFSAERRKRYLPPVHGGRSGGRLQLATPDGEFTVDRHAADAAAPERVEILSGEEPLRDDRLLVQMLGGVDEIVYRNIFAIGLREIQELGSLSDTEAAQWLYKLAVGTDRVSLVDVISELNRARGRLLADGQEPSTIPQLLHERDELRRQSSAHTSVRQFLDLRRKRGELVTQIARWEADADEAERAARLVEIAAAIFDKWHARAALDKELAAARKEPRVEQQTLSDFTALEQSLARVRTRHKKLSRLLAKTKHDIDRLGLDTAVSQRAARIESLLEQEQWITALDAERVALADKVAALETRRAELCAQLGFDPAGAAGEGGGKAWRQLKSLAVELRRARAALAEATEAAGTKQQSSQSTSQELTAALKARGATSLTPLLESSGQLVAQLRKRIQLDDRVNELVEREKELEERSRGLVDKLLLPGWAMAGLGTGFASGVAASLAGVFLPASLVGDSRLALVALGLISSGGSGAAKVAIEKTFARRSSQCLAQLESLVGQIDAAKQERDALDKELPRGGGPLLARLQAAEKDHAAIQALVPLESKRQAGSQDASEAEKCREQAHAAYSELRHRWRHALIDAGLSPKTPPGRAGQMAKIRQILARVDTRLEEERRELARRQSVVEAFANRLAQLRAELDVPGAGKHLDDAPFVVPMAPKVNLSPTQAKLDSLALPVELRALREKLHEQAALVAERQALVRRGKRLAARRQKVRHHGRRLERKLLAFLDREGAADAAELRRRAEDTQRSDQLVGQQETLGIEIAALVGTQVHEDDLAQLVRTKTRAELDNAWLAHSSRARDVREKVKSAHEQLGRWEQETQMLVAGREPAQARVRLGAVEQQLRDARKRWQTLAATEHFLAGIRKRYERERQPETLREASGYLERLTSGRYVRVWTPLDEHVLRVDDAEGNVLAVDVLSRGTREQLFLSLRLALVRWYARRGIELPLVLDDVLVNFDARRSRAAAEVLRDFAARGHQLLVFTCHEHIYDLFRSLGVTARRLPANPRLLAFGVIDEQEVPHEPIAPLVAPATRIETIEPAPVPATNGHTAHLEEPAPAPPPPPPAPPPAPAKKKRTLVKFDTVHGPRGPFATALWHERITYELSGERPDEPELPPHDDEDDWIDIDAIE